MSSPKHWVLRIDPDVLKEAGKIPRHDARKIFEALRLLPDNPYFGNIQKMKGQENVWRRRIGSYRLFYKLSPRERIILVFHLERRTSTTY